VTCVRHPSSYPMGMFKELHNKLPAIKMGLQNPLGNLCYTAMAIHELQK